MSALSFVMVMALGVLSSGCATMAVSGDKGGSMDIQSLVVRSGTAEQIKPMLLEKEPRIAPRTLFPLEAKEVLWWAQFKPMTFLFGEPIFKGKLFAPDGTLAHEVDGKLLKPLHADYATVRFPMEAVGQNLPQGQWKIQIFWKDRLIDERGFILGTKETAVASGSTLPAAQQRILIERQLSLAREARRQGDYARALSILDSAMVTVPAATPRLSLIKGLLRVEQGEYSRAVQDLSAAQRLLPDEIRVYHGLAEAHRGLGQWNEAEQLIRKAMVLDPQRAETYGYFGMLLKDQGKMREAREAFQQAHRLDPANPDVESQLAP